MTTPNLFLFKNDTAVPVEKSSKNSGAKQQTAKARMTKTKLLGVSSLRILFPNHRQYTIKSVVFERVKDSLGFFSGFN